MSTRFLPKKRSLARHEVPAWFHDAKLGIFVHWGLYSVPAYAPVGDGDLNEIMARKGIAYHFKHNPYAEWYLNSLRIEGSPVQAHHARHHGNAPYEAFAGEFARGVDAWDPGSWADLFQRAGARYAVLVTKHHDGFLLWPSEHPNPRREGYHAARDVVGEFCTAMRARGMRVGTYYSGVLDWSFQERPVVDFPSMLANGPRGREYREYAVNHWRELVDRHHVDILWNDIGFPPGCNINELLAWYYNAHPDGVVNDRWVQVPVPVQKLLCTWPFRAIANAAAKRAIQAGKSAPAPCHHDFTTPEYLVLDRVRQQKWEATRGIGFSFGYNKEETAGHYMTVERLVHLFVDIVSKNGNLLLNVGPDATGAIPALQARVLEGFGDWVRANGEGIFGTRPWRLATSETTDGVPVRFTSKGDDVFAFVLGPASGPVEIKGLSPRQGDAISLLATGEQVPWRAVAGGIVVDVPASAPALPATGIHVCT